MEAVGLRTFIWNNNLRSLFLLAGFPLLLFILLYALELVLMGMGWVREPYDAGVLYGVREVDRAPVVSPVQLYLDLSQTKGRGEEGAAAILEQVIKPTWH